MCMMKKSQMCSICFSSWLIFVWNKHCCQNFKNFQCNLSHLISSLKKFAFVGLNKSLCIWHWHIYTVVFKYFYIFAFLIKILLKWAVMSRGEKFLQVTAVAYFACAFLFSSLFFFSNLSRVWNCIFWIWALKNLSKMHFHPTLFNNTAVFTIHVSALLYSFNFKCTYICTIFALVEKFDFSSPANLDFLFHYTNCI